MLDSAYCEYASGALGYGDGLELARSADNIIVTRTFSKLYGLAALRIGWAYAPRAIAETVERMRLPYNTSAPAQAAAIAALKDEAFVHRSILQAQSGRERLTAVLRDCGAAPLPSATNFVTARFASCDAAAVERALADRGILVRGLANYGMADCLRVTAGAPADIEAFAEALAAVTR